MQHSLKIAWRNAFAGKSYTVINILGLALGIVCSLFILLWIRDERQIDQIGSNGDKVYLLYESRYVGDQTDGGYGTRGLLAAALKEEIPEIQFASGVSWLKDTPDQVLYTVGNKNFMFDTYSADSDFFKIMSYPFVIGNPSKALTLPKSICISERVAINMFGSARAAYGQLIRYDNKNDLQITGVFRDIPKTASAKFDCMINWSDFLSENSWALDWGNSGPNTIIMLRDNADPKLVSKKIKHFLDKYTHPTKQYRTDLGMQLFRDSYLHDKFVNGQIAGGRIQLIRLFSIIAIFIIAIACINFVNLATAQAAKRAKEVGVRKVAGASRLNLIGQFLSESMLLILVAFFIALAVVNFLLPFFNTYINKQIIFPYADPHFWLGLLTLAILIGLASGVYPAILISSFKPTQVLKGSVSAGKTGFFRKGLVIFQFTIAIALIIATTIVSQQLRFMEQTALGYNKRNLLVIPIQGNMVGKFEYFKQKAHAINGVRSISETGELPTHIGSTTVGVTWPGKDINQPLSFTQTPIGYDFVRTMGIHLMAGRDYSRDRATDTSGFIINESAQKLMGDKDIVGKNITFWGKTGPVIGVIKDFHFSSLHDQIKPLILHWSNLTYGNMLLRINDGMTAHVLKDIAQLYSEVNPGLTFSYSFIDEDYQKLYSSENILGKLSGSFSFLAIFISGLGLLGLILHAVSRRRKEMGIRKILGARAMRIVVLLSKEFMQHVLIAFLIAAPVSWWLMHQWLAQYAYKISIKWWVFLLAGAVAMLIAIFTVGLQALRTARSNPVNAIKTE